MNTPAASHRYDFALDYIRDRVRRGATKFYASEVAEALGTSAIEAYRRLASLEQLGAIWVSFRSVDGLLSYLPGGRIPVEVDAAKLFVTYAPTESFAHRWWLA